MSAKDDTSLDEIGEQIINLTAENRYLELAILAISRNMTQNLYRITELKEMKAKLRNVTS